MSTDNSVEEASAAAAAAAALRQSAIESWTLYAIGVTVTVLRTYARIRAVGARNLRAEDFLVWVGIVFYTAQTALAYNIGNAAHGLANNGMTDAERAALSPSDPEYGYRVIGSKIQVAGWTTYTMMMASLKLSMLAFYIRLTDGLGRRYRIPIHAGFALVGGTFLATMLTIFTACRPFDHNWQIIPEPSNACQPAHSKPIVWVSFASNVVTDIYLILIPIPMLWKSQLRLLKKIASTIVFGAGLFIVGCTIAKTAFVLVDPVNGAALAGEWGTRETFVAVVITNLPMLFHLVRTALAFVFGSAFQSSHKTYKSPSGLQTIGGGGGESYSRHRGRHSVHRISANLTFSESEERIVNDLAMKNLTAHASPVAGASGAPSSNGIVVSSQFEIVREDRSSHHTSAQREQQTQEPW